MTDAEGFLLSTSDTAPVVSALEVLRVDAFDRDGLATVSGQLRLGRQRTEEFRAEDVAVTALTPARSRLCGIAITKARRTRYLLAFEPSADGRQGHLLVQRVVLRPGFGAERLGSALAGDGLLQVGPIQAVDCGRTDDTAFRQLHLGCRIDPALARTQHLDAVLAAFECRDSLRACLGVVPSPHPPSPHMTVEGALADAGIAISARASVARRESAGGERLAAIAHALLADEGADVPAVQELGAWSPRDLDGVLQRTIVEEGAADPERWVAAFLLVPRFAERPSVIGTMFGSAAQPRRGAALFVDPAGSAAWTAGDRTRACAFSAVHEIGHLLNLLHCFEADRTEHRRQPMRPEAASFMNYPNRFPFGAAASPTVEAACRSLFWQRFAGRFGDDERLHLRHGWADFVRPGGVVELSMSTDTIGSAALPGLDEADPGGFSVDGLLEASPDLLEMLTQPPSSAAETSGCVSLGLHLPACVRLGEPVLGWLELANGSAVPELVPADLDPASGLVRVELVDASGQAIAFEPGRRDCGAGLDLLEPAGRRTQPLQLSFGQYGYLTEPGSYRITVTCGTQLAAAHDLVIEPPAPSEERLVDRLFADERIGLALLGEAASAPSARDLDALVADRASAPPALRVALEHHRLDLALHAAVGAVEVEHAFRALLRALVADRRSAGGAWRWRHTIRRLHEAALALLRADHLQPNLAARLADRAARTSLAVLGGRAPELGTARTAWAIRRAARTLAASAANDRPQRPI